MADWFKNVKDRTNPADRWYAITPNDSTDLPIIPRGVICTSDGDLEAIDANGTSLIFAMTEGDIVPLRPTRVGTSSTGTFYALY